MDSISDPIMQYFQALDAGDFERLDKVLEAAQQDDALEVAIMALHARLGPDEPYSQQIQQLREGVKA